MAFKKATKSQARARVALIGPSGSGKTYSALAIATGLGARVAVVDTERGSASKYADQFAFDVLCLDTFGPLDYVRAIHEADAAGYDVLVIDSLSHAWMGKGGALDQVDMAAKRSKSNNTFNAWRDITPQHNALIDAMLGSRCHVIATMRAKSEYVIEKDERTGKSAPRKVGLAAVQRDGMEFEFDVAADLDLDHNLLVSKTRCPALDNAVVNKPGREFGEQLRAWLTDGEPAQPQTEAEPAETDQARRFAAWCLALSESKTHEEIATVSADITKHKGEFQRVQLQKLAQVRGDAIARVNSADDAATDAAFGSEAAEAEAEAHAAQYDEAG